MKYFDFCQLSHASLTLKYQILICRRFIINQLFRENSAERELPAVKESEVRLRYFRWSSLVLHYDEDFFNPFEDFLSFSFKPIFPCFQVNGR